MADTTRTVTGYPARNQHPNGVYQPPPPPPCSAYPFAALPPQTYPHAPPRAAFFPRFFASIVATIILTGTIILITWLVLHPRLPHFRVDTFKITSPFNLTTNHLSTSWDVALTATNPNEKISFYYDDILAAVFYRGESLAVTYMAPFGQGKREEWEVKASFVAANTFVVGEDVGRMNEERGRGRGHVGFNVRIVADVRFRAGIWRARKRLLKVYCGDLVVEVGGNGSNNSSNSGGLSGGPRECSVEL